MISHCKVAEEECIAQGRDGADTAVGVVVIGRNEGVRLQSCLKSLWGVSDRTVYVDSGSSDDSVTYGRSIGITVVELDLTVPFTAARARNAGFAKLIGMHPSLGYIFFVDGDCEVVPGWIEKAVGFLNARPDIAIVFGYRRERYPNRSIYNLLCDMEWRELPVGESKQCGGDIVVRVSAFRQVEGFRSELICGEEPELCLRLRRNGWLIWRLQENMTLHDAAMYRFGQWWKRCVRAGFGYAQGTYLHGASPDRHWVSESRRAWIWGLWIPAAILVMAVTINWKVALLLAVYPLQMIRIAVNGGLSTRENWVRAGALVLGKFPEAQGQLKFLKDRYLRVRSRLIEYK